MIRDEMLVPAVKALDARTISSLATSTQVTFLPTTQYLEINAENQAIYCHLGAAATTADNGYDYFVMPGQTKVFRITDDMRKTDKYIALIEKATGASATVIQYQRN